MVRDNLVLVQILDLNIIAALLLIPVCANNLVLRLDIFVQGILSRKVVKVVEDLL